MRTFSLAFSFALVALVACGKSDSQDAQKGTGEGEKPATASKGSGTGAAQAQTGGPAPVGAAPAPAAMPARPGRSSMPTLAEWGSQQKEVTVKGSSALGCETKIIREYLRVSCRGKNDTGGTPTHVAVKKGGRGEALTYVGGGVASLIVPFIEGIDFAADFSWTDKSHTLTVKWPRGSARPTVVGVFEGAKSPLDGAAGDAALADKLCACHKKVMKEATCDSLLGAPDADCDRTYGNDCSMLLACSRHEPGAFPRCRPGYRNAFLGGCFKECGGAKGGCAANETCEDLGVDNAKVCLES